MNQNESLIQSFGYSEMYEWSKIPEKKLGLFVQFDKHNPDKILPYQGGILLGISTVNSSIESDNPNEWKYAYKCNEVGDLFFKKETLAVGIKEYDQSEEMSFIHTQPWSHYVKIPTEIYDKNIKYIKRTDRKEWVRVNLLGKVIVRDNGKCIPGQFCEPYIGEDMEFVGGAIPATSSGKHKFYVLERITDNTIMILNNSLTNLHGS